MEKKPTKTLVLVSGGTDSSTLFYEANSKRKKGDPPINGLYIRTGKVFDIKEIEAVKKIVKLVDGLLEIVDARPIIKVLRGTSKENERVSFSSGLVLSIGLSHAAKLGCNKLLIGWQENDSIDGSEYILKYVLQFNGIVDHASKLSNRLANLVVQAPYAVLTKPEIFKRAKDLEIDLSLTWSCYNNGQIHCGVCDGCKARHDGFVKAGLSDPTDYEIKPDLEGFDPRQMDVDDIWELRP